MVVQTQTLAVPHLSRNLATGGLQFLDVFRGSKEIQRNDGCHPLSPTVGFAAPQETRWPPQASGQKDPQMISDDKGCK